MRKALVNYWVDVVTGAAFLFCAVTGLVRLFPAETVSISSSGEAVILGVGAAVWQTVHDWSGAVMAAGVAVHTLLHLRWLGHMTRRIVKGAEKRPARVTAASGGGGTRVAATVVVPAGAAPGAAPAVAPRVGAAEELERLERGWAERRRESERRHTRKAFLTGAAAVGGAALLAGLGLAGRDAAGGLLDRSAEQAPAETADGQGYGESDEDPAYPTASQGSNAGAASGASTARVAVDAASCVGCGACLQVCPTGVFAASGGVATAQDPSACRLCGRCTQVCRPGAITLNG